MSAADITTQLLKADATLMRRIALGEGVALKMLFADTSSHVAVLALRILGNASEAEDVVQETFSQVWRTACDFDSGRGTALAWVLMIARTRSVDRLRAQQRRRSAELEPLPPATWPLAREDHDRLLRELAGLPDTQSELLRLAYFEGMSQSEIAVHLRLPLGTVKTRMRSALARLSEQLEDPVKQPAEQRR